MRFPKFSPNGDKLAYEDGGGRIIIEAPGSRIDLAGNRPCWLTNDKLLHTTNNGATFELGNPVPIFPTELHELAAGGGRYAGVTAGRLLVRNADGSELLIAGAGQPFLDRNGQLVYKSNDHRLHWTCLHGQTAHRDEPSRSVVTSWGHIYPGEGWPRLIWTPGPIWLLTMTNTTFRLREVPGRSGFEIPTGEDRNLEADGAWVAGVIKIACNSGIYKQSLQGVRTVFDGPSPVPVPKPPPVPEPPPMTPNRLDVVRDEFNKQPPSPNSTESCGEFTRRVARRLHRDDPNWGMLTKTPGEAQYQGFAVDALIYRTTQQVIDILAGAEGPSPSPAWQEVPKRNINHWAAPPESETTTPDPKPTPDLSALIRRIDQQDVEIAKLQQQARKRIALKSAHGRYVCIEPDGRVIADRERVGGWELLEVERE